MKASGRSAVPGDGNSERDQQSREQIAGSGDQNAAPFADTQPDQVQTECRQESGQGDGDCVPRIFRIADARWTEHKAGHRHPREQQRRKIANIADEVEPRAQEAVPVSKGLFCPDIEATLLGKLPG